MRAWLQGLRQRWRSHLGTVLLVLGVFVAVQAWQTRHVPNQVDADALVLTVLSPDGMRTTETLAQALARWQQTHPGQPVAVHVWAQWCPICRAEEGSVSALAQDWPVLTVAMQSGDAGQVQALLRQRGLAWHTAVDPQASLSKALGVQAVPAFMVVDASHRVRMPTVGYTSALGMRMRLWWVRLMS